MNNYKIEIFSVINRSAILSLIALFAATISHGAPSDDVKVAGQKLADAANYSWTVTTVNASSGAVPSAINPNNPINGKTEKGGFTVVTTIKGSANGRQMTATTITKGDKTVMPFPSGSATWLTQEELIARLTPSGGTQPPPAAIARMVAVPVLPAAEIASLAAKVKEFKAVDGVLAGDLSVDDVTPLLMPSVAGTIADTQSSRPQNVIGSLRIWLKNGTLTKYELHAKGTFTLGTDSWQVDLTVTTEIKDIGTTIVDVPAAAKEKLGSKSSAPALVKPVS